MPADIIQVQYDQLSRVASQFGRTAENVVATQQQVLRSAQQLRQGGWEGRGSAAIFAELDGVVAPVLHRLSAALAEAKSVTLQIAQVMYQAEEDAARPFKGTGVSAAQDVGKPPGLAAIIPEHGQPLPDPYMTLLKEL